MTMILGHFTSGDDLNLVLAKVNHLEILTVTPEGLRPVKQFTINGQVSHSNDWKKSYFLK